MPTNLEKNSAKYALHLPVIFVQSVPEGEIGRYAVIKR
jgi:hypothetical protein